ncbi:VOC family protein [Dyadobacter luteus]|uniref:VOC family protein n=1 Tax=Dyadobacter luteus TaxID=2259619 RepID=A0A3D8YAW7_9BACT|nr:VOC family protein [Dyadobacter luteus]REA60917.1 VOC family protein [Dyadobacter luteus]
MRFKLGSIILYVRDVTLLRTFYTYHFGMTVLEEFGETWALLAAGDVSLGLHQMGEQYLAKESNSVDEQSNAKLVLDTDTDIEEVVRQLIENGVSMREIKTFDNYDFWLCDGIDPEGNVFQIRQRKTRD